MGAAQSLSLPSSETRARHRRKVTGHHQKKYRKLAAHIIIMATAFTRRYLHLIGRADSPDCEEHNIPVTTEHVFCVFPRYAAQGQSLAEHLSKFISQPLSEKVLLRAWPELCLLRGIQKALVKFLQDSCLDLRLWKAFAVHVQSLPFSFS